MPYIKQEERGQYDYFIDVLVDRLVNRHTGRIKVGALNYVFTRLIHVLLLNVGLKYESINDITGVIGCFKTEWERRIVGPYENEKNEQNGDVIGVH